MISKEITAKNMAKLATKDNEELNNILKAIKFDANNGYRKLIVDGVIKDATEAELEKRGFKVEIGGRYNERDTYIEW